MSLLNLVIVKPLRIKWEFGISQQADPPTGVTRNWELGIGCLMLDTGYWMLDAGCHPEGIFAVAGKILVLDVVY
jgi:hypothetical protein